MVGSRARFEAVGSLRLLDDVSGRYGEWTSAAQWAQDWLAEWRAGDDGAASAFLDTACDDAVAGVVDALVALAETADGAAVLAYIGAGPLENLLSHSGNGLRVLEEVDRAARRSPAFRAALSGVWLSSDVPEPVRERLSVLGASLIR